MHTRLPLALACAVLGGAPVALAQHSLIVSPDAEFVLKNAATPPAIGLVDDQETIIVTPDANNSYDARPFRTFPVINVAHGDGDLDGDLNDTDPYGDVNCLFVRNRPPNADTGPFAPGDLWMSCTFNTTAMIATSTGTVQVLDGDVFRGRHGKVEFFVRELFFLDALGNTNGANFDIDGLVQDAQGNLMFTIWDNNRGTNPVVGPFPRFPLITDGDLFYISANDITYDSQGLITAITFDSAKMFASEGDLDLMVVNSGTMQATGIQAVIVGDTAGLNVDPNGGTWISPQDPTLTFPNIIFASNFLENFDNIWSTANGGSPAIINGVVMAYTTGPADGTKLGVGQLPTAQDAINAIALVPAQSGWIAIDSPQSGGVSQGQFVFEIGRVQPNSPVGLLIATWPNNFAGGWVDGIPLPQGLGLGGNRFFELGIVLADVALTADANGYATLALPAPATAPPGLDLLIQGVGLPFGQTARFSATGTSNLTF